MRFRTAVRLKSWSRRPDMPAAQHARCQDRRTDPRVLAFPSRDRLALASQDFLQPGVILEREDPRLSVLRVAQENELALPVDVCPLEPERLAGAPAGEGEIEKLHEVSCV